MRDKMKKQSQNPAQENEGRQNNILNSTWKQKEATGSLGSEPNRKEDNQRKP